MSDKKPYDFVSFFVDDLLHFMVDETNRYASQKVKKMLLPEARIKQWKDTDVKEMKILLGMQLWFELVQMSRLTCY